MSGDRDHKAYWDEPEPALPSSEPHAWLASIIDRLNDISVSQIIENYEVTEKLDAITDEMRARIIQNKPLP